VKKESSYQGGEKTRLFCMSHRDFQCLYIPWFSNNKCFVGKYENNEDDCDSDCFIKTFNDLRLWFLVKDFHLITICMENGPDIIRSITLFYLSLNGAWVREVSSKSQCLIGWWSSLQLCTWNSRLQKIALFKTSDQKACIWKSLYQLLFLMTSSTKPSNMNP